MKLRIVLSLAALASGVSLANAADMPVKAPVMAPAIAYNWTGFYVGAHVGGGWSHTSTYYVDGNPAYPAGTTASGDQDGFLGGLQVGYNWQFAPNWLLGAEGDFSWADIKGDSSAPSTVPRFVGTRLDNSTTKIDWTATLTGRLGYVMDAWLFYAKGGVAWGHKQVDSNTTNPVTGVLLTTVSSDVTRTGWTAGGGVEWAFLKNWSMKLEYDYLDFGKEDEVRTPTYLNGASGLATLTRNVDWHVHELKFGVNYRF